MSCRARISLSRDGGVYFLGGVGVALSGRHRVGAADNFMRIVGLIKLGG